MTIVVPFHEFEFAFHSLVSEAKPFIAWFTAEKDEHGNTWCPDCKAASPYLQEVRQKAEKKGLKVYVFQVGPKEGYKSPQFVMRTNKIIKLKCIPTVAFFNGKAFTRRLEQAQILDQKQRNLLFEDD